MNSILKQVSIEWLVRLVRSMNTNQATLGNISRLEREKLWNFIETNFFGLMLQFKIVYLKTNY